MLKASAGVELREVPASKHFKRLDSHWGFSSGNKIWINAHDNKWFDNLHQPLGGDRHSFQRRMWGSDIASGRKSNLTTFTVFPYIPLCISSKAFIYLIFPSPPPTFYYDQWIVGSFGSPPLVPDDITIWQRVVTHVGRAQHWIPSALPTLYHLLTFLKSVENRGEAACASERL